MSSIYPFKSLSEGEKKESMDEFALFENPLSKPLSAAEMAAPMLSFDQLSSYIQSKRREYVHNHSSYQKNITSQAMVTQYFFHNPNINFVVWKNPYTMKYFFSFRYCVENQIVHGLLIITNSGLVLDFSDVGGEEHIPQPTISAIAAMLTRPVRKNIAVSLLEFVERERKYKEVIKQSQLTQFSPTAIKKAQAFHNKIMKFSMPPQVPESWENVVPSASLAASEPIPMELDSPRNKC